ncbi:monooxygenase [Aureimonas sp. Leaf454]|uniref:flavin-containing monooxygenase n=1 Tax=Aureimonas sp. Leaf454 TaxID=1736381 RepID=UPI0006F39E55|nr:NAD(P)/FAD-dependent oxidoreductase [Aureimonas sp. Leaf454]KQT44595.1 monooxygenase [Aureimonas sp. Leaf454]
MVQKKNVCVIGAGVSGIAAARTFKRRGHRVTIVERSDGFGGVWEPQRSYPEVQTQSPKSLYRYTDKAMPADYPEWPKGPQVHAYLKSYAEDHGLTSLLRTRTVVRGMEKRQGAPGWTLDIEAPDGTSARENYDFVVIATGQFNERNVPTHPGEAAFVEAGGTVMHSSLYDRADRARGRDVVVLGGSKSATDIAVNAVKSGARSVTMVYREPVWRVPYFIGGLVNFKRILYIRAQEEMFPGWGIGRGAKLAHAIAKPFVWANWRGLEALLKTQQKLKRCKMTPRVPIERSINCSVPIATPGFFDMVASGRIRGIEGTFSRYEPGLVHMTGGEAVPADVVVQATGFKLGVPFLPPHYAEKLVEPDGQYRLHRLIANPNIPDLGFVGFNSSFCTVLCADLAAEWLVRYADGKLVRDTTHEAMTKAIEVSLKWRRTERPAAAVYGGLCVAPYHFKHFDELIGDMGARITRRNPLAEKFLPPDADAYSRFLASTPTYTVT